LYQTIGFCVTKTKHPAMDCRSLSHMNGMGEIQLILGPMFSGKTTELLRRMRRYQIARRKCVLIKYVGDTRYDNGPCVVTHDQEKQEAFATKHLSDVETDSFDVIGVDEGQFYPDLVSFCESMANRGKIVIVAGLDGSYLRRPFPTIADLIPLSESIVKLSAICMKCSESAAFTSRLTNETGSEVIGGSDKYMATCRKCFV